MATAVSSRTLRRPKRKIQQSKTKGSSSRRRVVLASPSSFSTDTGVPISERMMGMRKSVGEPAILSVSTAPSVQAIEEVAELTSGVQIPDRNAGLELTIFSGLPGLSKISIEPRIEEALGAVLISDSIQLACLQDRIQEVSPASEAPFEDVVNPSIGPANVQPQSIVNPPRFEKEIRCPEIQHPIQWMFKREFAQTG
ncbi:hypothetical protein Nepgr_028852 [Nepenthes gracilis]|uniref:Uncharacterized protein n=1 Tax=Nepenthes gracilis TaxID=150966 RepID=A0AAD3TD07_NEPGR|nr:hypothetical protein Nepgr_028852 [Nepenthes gracilis]